MGITVEFNPDLALRNIREFEAGRREAAECIPPDLAVGDIYPFLKSGQRNYWLEGEIPLLETAGDNHLSKPKASILILEVTHQLRGKRCVTSGKYKVVEIFNDQNIHFNGFAKL
ncbi:MAG: hypothetical protein HUU49_03965 [Candidatus Buchananbacteria bacterium]|nr:hypothetical protein [Candidatus Buchananbacteria bacterium]